MSDVQMLKAFVLQRLTAAAEDIFEMFERTIAGYEDKLRGQRQPEAVLEPSVCSLPADVQLLVRKRGVPSPTEQEELGLNWERPHVKEEQVELYTSHTQEEALGSLEEADVTEFTFTHVPMKSEESDDEDMGQCSRLHHAEEMKTEAAGGDCGGPQSARELNPESHFQLVTANRIPWEGISEPLSGYKDNPECSSGPVGSTEFARSIRPKKDLQERGGVQTAVRPFCCSVCGKQYLRKKTLADHMRLHSELKRFSCSVCKKTFTYRSHFVMHMRVHTGEKPFSCTVCGKRFGFRVNLGQHMRLHTGEKPFSCQDCGKSFTQLPHMKNHKCAGERSERI